MHLCLSALLAHALPRQLESAPLAHAFGCMLCVCELVRTLHDALCALATEQVHKSNGTLIDCYRASAKWCDTMR